MPRSRSVLGLVDQAIAGDPRHHAAQLGADFLDLMVRAAPPHRLEARLARIALLDPVAREAAGLDIVQNALHLALGLFGHDTRTARIVAIFGRVADRIAPVGRAALVGPSDGPP